MLFAECLSVKCHYPKGHTKECYCAECLSVTCHSAECHFEKYCYTKCCSDVQHVIKVVLSKVGHLAHVHKIKVLFTYLGCINFLLQIKTYDITTNTTMTSLY